MPHTLALLFSRLWSHPPLEWRQLWWWPPGKQRGCSGRHCSAATWQEGLRYLGGKGRGGGKWAEWGVNMACVLLADKVWERREILLTSNDSSSWSLDPTLCIDCSSVCTHNYTYSRNFLRERQINHFMGGRGDIVSLVILHGCPIKPSSGWY